MLFFCKGTSKRIDRGEKELWDDRVKDFWQKKTWIDSVVMIDLSRHFFEGKVAVHREDLWVILFCDNLSPYLDEEVNNIFGEIKVILCFLPPNMTNFFQPIDARLGRLVRLSVGRNLDEWLVNNDNMSRWEGTTIASERRILTTNIVGKAMSGVMDTSKQGVIVACFEPSCLIINVVANETNY